MIKRKKKRKKLDLTRPVERPRMGFGVLFRVFLIGSIAVVASSYALYRHYVVPRPSMLVPAQPRTAPAPDPAGEGLLLAPEVIPLPASPPPGASPPPAASPPPGAPPR